MLSMTGFGRSTKERDGRTVMVEIKTVNHRFLDISVKMPRSVSFAEDAVKKCVSSRLKRGHVEVSISYSNVRQDARQVQIDEDLAAKYTEAVRRIALENNLNDSIDASFICSLPDVLTANAACEDIEAVTALLEESCGEACDMLVGMRKAEGDNLKQDLLYHLSLLEKLRDDIAVLAPEVPKLYRERLTARLQEASVQCDPQRLAQEVALMADKCAIDEELSRLLSHFAQMHALMDEDGEVGKKLDFLTQELNRECNTIGSKANDARITSCVVNAKNEVEKIREQVQNVE